MVGAIAFPWAREFGSVGCVLFAGVVGCGLRVMGWAMGNGQWVRVGLWKMGLWVMGKWFFGQISMYARMCVRISESGDDYN